MAIRVYSWHIQLFLIDGFCSKNPVLARWQPPQAICYSIPLAFCWKARLGRQTCIILSPQTGFSSFPLQLSIWHSSRLLTGLLDFKVSHSVIHLLHRNKLLFSSCCFLPCVMGQQSWILVGSLLWEKLCLCSQTPLSTWLSWQALTQWCFTKRCT